MPVFHCFHVRLVEEITIETLQHDQHRLLVTFLQQAFLDVPLWFLADGRRGTLRLRTVRLVARGILLNALKKFILRPSSRNTHAFAQHLKVFERYGGGV